MKLKGLILGGLLSIAMAVTFIPNTAFAAPQEGGDVQAVTLQTEEVTVTPDVDLADPDELLMQYLEKTAAGDPAPAPAKAAKKAAKTNRLSGNDAAIYDALLEEITKIANGETDSAVIDIPAEQILGQRFFTAEELGVDSIFALDEDGEVLLDEEGNASFSDDALDAFDERIAFDGPAIVNRLLVDCPYNLYWFDKTEGYFYGWMSADVGMDYIEDDPAMGFVDEDAAVEFTFNVSADYQADGQETVIDISKTGGANAAANTAADIVDNYAGDSDLDKLNGYRSTICGLTSYNDEAADDTIDTPYGNPWQLIWVFDDDPDTNVVCEGYAKAYQFLCDLSDFDEGVESRIVTGTMDGGTGAGAHMWNIMSMDDGENYLVDVTNCDEGTIGADDQLFLKGYSDCDEDASKYTFACEGGNVIYAYDADTLDLYDASELELSAEAYTQLTQGEKDQRAADKVIALINNVIEFGEITEENAEDAESLIIDAREAYDALTEDQQARVTNFESLVEAEQALEEIRDSDEPTLDEEVAGVIALIDALSEINGPEDITEEVSEQISAARDAYDALSWDQQQEVTNYEVLKNAEFQQMLAGSSEIELDMTEKVKIAHKGDEAVFWFTPDHDGTYIFTSSGNKDTIAEAYDASGDQIASDDDGGPGANFQLVLKAKAGETYVLNCRLLDKDKVGSFEVSLTESTVREIAYTFADDHTLIEGVSGDWREDGEENQFFYYETPSWEANDVLTVTDTDGNTEDYICQQDDEEGWVFASESGKMIDHSLVGYDDDQYDPEKHWGLGSDNEVKVSYMGAETTAYITIVPNPVTAVSFARDGKAEVSLVENRTGDYDTYLDDDDVEQDYFRYEIRFRDGDTLTISKTDGTSEVYTWLDREYGFYRPGHPVIDRDDIRVTSNQGSEAQWMIGDEDLQFTLSYFGQECTVDAEIVSNPIETITYEGSPIALTEGYLTEKRTGDEGEYDWYEVNREDISSDAKLILTGEDSVAGTYVYNQEEGEFRCDDRVIDLWDLEFTDTQDEIPWTVGSENISTWRYEGIEFEIPVTITENEIESISFTPAEATYIIFEQEDRSPGINAARDELYRNYGHTLTITKTDQDPVTYEYKEMNDEESGDYREGYFSEDGDFIDFQDVSFRAVDDFWTAGSGAVMTASYLGVESNEFTLPVQSPIVRIEYEPANEYEVYDGLGEAYEDEFIYNIMTERAGDRLYVYNSDAEDAEPAFAFVCDAERDWMTEDGVRLYRIGDFCVQENQPWEGDPENWEMTAILSLDNYDDAEFETQIPVKYNETIPVTAVSYTQSSEIPKVYQGLDDGLGEAGFAGYSAVTEGDTVTITRKIGESEQTKTYVATLNESYEEWQFVNRDDDTDILDNTYLQIDSDQAEDNVWPVGEHAFTFSYFGVSEDADGNPAQIRVNVCENPITKVVFTPKTPIVWDADTAHWDEVTDEEGNAHTIYRIRYEDAGDVAVSDGDTLVVTRDGEDIEYIYSDERATFVDDQDRSIQIPWYYTDDQEEGDYWKIGENQAYIECGGVRSEPFAVTIKCNHRFLQHTEAVEATCTEPGSEEYWTCPICGTLFSDEDGQEVIKAPVKVESAHDWGEWKELDENLHQRICNKCDVSEKEEHSWNDGEVTTEPTETTPGERTYTCDVCGATKTEVIPETTHKHVLKATEAKAATCTEDGNIAYWTCEACGKYFSDADGENEITKADTVVKALGHEWSDPAYEWAADNSKVTATRVCSHDAKHKETETVNTTEKVTKEATCEEDGSITYTASFKNEAFATQTKETATEALGHDWSEPTYKWADDNSTVTATRVCSHDAKHKETETVNTTEKVTKEATCEEGGSITYTASFKNEAFATQTKETAAEALGHDWSDPAYEWAEDNSKVTATRVCSHDAKHKETETVNTAEEVITDATETTPGEKKFTATFENPAFATQTKTVEIPETSHVHSLTAIAAKAATCTEDGNIAYWTCSCGKYFSDADGKNEITEANTVVPALGHKWGEPTYKWAADNSTVTATRVCSHDATHKETETVNTTEKVTKEATEMAAGEKTLTATFTKDAFKAQTKTVEIPATGGQAAVEAAAAANVTMGEAQKINAGSYSKKSYGAVQTALNELKALLADSKATAEQIKTATEKLNTAMSSLKQDQPMAVKAVAKKVKLKKVKKKAQTVSGAVKVTKAQGPVTYKGVGTNAKAKKALKINAKTGKITVKKKTKKGTYKMKVTVTAGGNKNYEAGSKVVVVTIKVK